MSPHIKTIKTAGFRVFVHGPVEKATYCYFTDGVRIGYAQWDSPYKGDESLSTVHMPNTTTGTGYKLDCPISADNLPLAFQFVPHWASRQDAATLKKYRDWNAFFNRDSFNSQLLEV